jgi:WD40 repeat protein
VATLRDHTDWIRALALSADNRWLYSGSDDATIKVWRLADRACTTTLTGQTDRVSALALSADNRWLFSHSADWGTTKVWRLSNYTVATTINDCDYCVFALSNHNRYFYLDYIHAIQIRQLPMLQLWHEMRNYQLSAGQAQRVTELLSSEELCYDDLRHVIRAWSVLWLAKSYVCMSVDLLTTKVHWSKSSG